MKSPEDILVGSERQAIVEPLLDGTHTHTHTARTRNTPDGDGDFHERPHCGVKQPHAPESDSY